MQAASLRNYFRAEARKAMLNESLAQSLNKTDPPLTWEAILQKYKSRGWTGEDLYREILSSSSRTRREVNNHFNIDTTKE